MFLESRHWSASKKSRTAPATLVATKKERIESQHQAAAAAAAEFKTPEHHGHNMGPHDAVQTGKSICSREQMQISVND